MLHTCIVVAFSPAWVWGRRAPLGPVGAPQVQPRSSQPHAQAGPTDALRCVELGGGATMTEGQVRIRSQSSMLGGEQPSPALPLTGQGSVASSASCCFLNLFWSLLFTCGAT